MQALARGCRHGEIVPIPQAPDGAISALLQLFEAAPPRKAGEFFASVVMASRTARAAFVGR